MNSGMIKILLLAVVVAGIVALGAMTAMKPKPEAQPQQDKMVESVAPPPVVEPTVEPVVADRAMVNPSPVQEPPPPVAEPEQQAAPVQEEVQAEQPAVTPTAEAVPLPVEPAAAQLQIGDIPKQMKILSDKLGAGQRLPLEYTCYSRNASPPLSWSNAPATAKGYVVFFERVNTEGGNTLQWAVYNIGADINALHTDLPKSELLSDGMGQAINDLGNVGYVGPCSPKGQIDFVVKVFALDTALALPGGLTKDALITAMNGHIVDVAEIPVFHRYRM